MLSFLAALDRHFGPLRVLRYITVRTLLAPARPPDRLSVGPWLIARMRRLKFGQHYDDDRTGDLAQRFDKKQTPTMGGLIIFGAVFVSSLLWAAPNIWVSGRAVCLHRPDRRRLSRRLSQGRAQEPPRDLVAGKDPLADPDHDRRPGLLLWHPASAAKIRELWVPFVKHPVVVTCPSARCSSSSISGWSAFQRDQPHRRPRRPGDRLHDHRHAGVRHHGVCRGQHEDGRLPPDQLRAGHRAS